MVQISHKHFYITTIAGQITNQITGMHHSTQVQKQTDWSVKQVHV